MAKANKAQNETAEGETTAMTASDQQGASVVLSPETQAMLDAFKKEGAARINPDVFFHRFGDEITILDKTGKPTGKKRWETYPIQGIITERRVRMTKPKEGEESKEVGYYILYTTAPCVLWKSTDGDNEGLDRIEAPPGTYAWVDERWSTQSLVAYLPKEQIINGIVTVVQIFECLIVPKSQKPIGGGHKVWQTEVHVKSRAPGPQYPTIAPRGNVPPPKQLSEAAQQDGDVPF